MCSCFDHRQKTYAIEKNPVKKDIFSKIMVVKLRKILSNLSKASLIAAQYLTTNNFTYADKL
jgi:hypothetical protein